MRILVSALGSRGDVHPVLSVAARLRSLGHEVRLIVPQGFAADVPRLGLEVRRIYSVDVRSLSARMKRSVGGMAQVFRWFLSGVAEQAELLVEEGRWAEVLLTSTAELGAPTAAEHLRIPHYRMCYAPILPGDHTPPVLPLPELPSPRLNRALWIGLNEGARLAFGGPLNRLRARLGLEPVRDMSAYLHRRCRTIFAFSPLLAPPDPSWATYDFEYAGCCFGEEGSELPDEVERFLDAGAPPVYLGFGSMRVGDPQRFGRLLVEAVKRAGVRMILARGWAELDPGELPEQMLLVDELPHRRLFPRLAGVCHHGGSGTTHTAARAGVPQLIMPYALDQLFWSRRVFALGLGPRPTTTRRADVDGLAAALWTLARAPELRARAAALARELRCEDGAATAARLVAGPAPAGELEATYGAHPC